ncbi:M48 family metalloprotease [Flavitalea flava]
MMRNLFPFILPVLFATLSVTLLFLVMQVFACYPAPFSDAFIFSGILIWNLFCFLAPRVFWSLPDPGLFFEKVRKPIREEEQKLQNCLNGLIQLPEKTIRVKKFRFLIRDETRVRSSAVGPNTIIVTKGMLQELPEAELTALLAHDLGHLQSGDALAEMAFTCATVPPRELCRILKKGPGLFRILLRKGKIFGLIGISFACLLLFYFHLFRYIIACLVFVLLFTLADWLFSRLWGVNRRYRVYEQDLFAKRLGAGPALKDVLKKMAQTDPEAYNRIRRLEAREEQ